MNSVRSPYQPIGWGALKKAEWERRMVTLPGSYGPYQPPVLVRADALKDRDSRQPRRRAY